MSYFRHTPNPIRRLPRNVLIPRVAEANMPAGDLVQVSIWGHVEALTSVILACTPSVCVVLARLYRKRRGESPILLQDQELAGANLGRNIAHINNPAGLSGSTNVGSMGIWNEELESKGRHDLSGASACSTLHEGPP